jgi:dolichol kinase
MVALLIYPDPAATIAIYALAFGDSAASLLGKFAGSKRIRGTQGKTLEGAFGCMVAVLIVASHFGLSPAAALAVAAVAAFTELLPLRDLDNLALPLTAGLTVVLTL